MSLLMYVSGTEYQTNDTVPSAFPELPWQKVGMNLFKWRKLKYLTIVDYYSRFIEKAQLDKTTVEEVTLHCKNIFSRHGIPEEVVTNNGSQFDSSSFHKFLLEYHFHYVTSSPCMYYPRGDGEAEHRLKL